MSSLFPVTLVSVIILLSAYSGNAAIIPSAVAQNSSEQAANSLYSRGIEAYEGGMYEEAIEYYDRALAIEPNNVRGLFTKGVTLFTLGRCEEAIEYYDRALAIEPNNVQGLLTKVQTLLNLGGCEEATEFPDVNGTFMSLDTGFQIDLPTGWKGKESNIAWDMVFAAPRGINSVSFQQLPATRMIIGVINEQILDVMEALSNLETVNTTTPLCTHSPPSFVTINGVNAEERLHECIDEEGETIKKIKSYAFATQNNSIISVEFSSNSTSTYDQSLPLFEESVKTINVSLPADIAASEIYNRYNELIESSELFN